MQEFLKKIMGWAATAGMNLIFAALILIIGLKIVDFFCKRVLKSEKLRERDPSLASFLKSLLSIVLRALVIFTAAIVLGIPSASFLTVFGSAAVAIGLALQGSLSNLAGGIMILSFKLFRVGDFIECGTVMGTVKSINVFYTILTTIDNRQLTVPNATLTNATVTNYSVEPTRRVDFVFDVDYGSDLDLVKSVLLRTAKDDPRVLFDPAPIVFMSGHRESALEYTMRVWCEREFYWELTYDMREKVKRAFDEAGILIPFNQLDIHIKDKEEK
jgi:small conductance mechanosensitive channel